MKFGLPKDGTSREVKKRDNIGSGNYRDRLGKIMPTYHESIMKNEVLRYLNIHMEGVIVDGTLGDGGHTEFILKIQGQKSECSASIEICLLLIGLRKGFDLLSIGQSLYTVH